MRPTSTLTRTTILVALLIGSLSPAALAQTEGADQEMSALERKGGLAFVDELSLTVVNIDVFVRGKNDLPITGLTVDDFKVYQDGAEKSVTNFATFTEEYFTSRLAEVEMPTLAPPTPVPETNTVEHAVEPDPIYIVLYVDNENLRQFDRNRVLRHVREFVRESLVPGVKMMVVSYQRSFKVDQPFTTDQRMVLGALREQSQKVGARGERETQRGRILNEIRHMYERREGVSSESGREYNELYEMIRSYAEETAYNLEGALQSIRSVGTMVAGLRGRKYLVYISNGLPMVPGKDLMYEFSTVNQEAPLLSMLAPYNRKYRFDALASTANAQGLTFYTVDATGVDPAASVSAEQALSTGSATFFHTENLQAPLQLIADKTGGMAIVNTNNFGDGLKKITSDLFTYYSIGYTINTSGADKIHHIKVELPGHPNARLRYRRTFVEKSLDSRIQDEVMSGLMFDLDKNPMQLATKTGSPAPAAEGRWVLPVEISFPMWTVAMLPEKEEVVGRVVVYVAARDTEGKQSDLRRQVHELRVPADDYENRRHERFVVEMQLLMEPGSYRVAVGLLDQITRQVSYQTFRELIREPG